MSEFDHIGILAADFTAALGLAEKLGIELGPLETKPEKGLEIQWLDAGGVQLELIRPLDQTGRAAGALREHGPGLHHIAVAVDDIDTLLGQLGDDGVPLRDPQARPGSRGTRIAFVEAEASGGTLVELVEHPDLSPNP